MAVAAVLSGKLHIPLEKSVKFLVEHNVFWVGWPCPASSSLRCPSNKLNLPTHLTVGDETIRREISALHPPQHPPVIHIHIHIYI